MPRHDRLRAGRGQEIDYGRQAKGYIDGAPANREAFTRPYPGRSTTFWVAFFEQLEQWLPEAERIYAIVNNLNSHPTADVLLFMPAHPLGGCCSSRHTPSGTT